MIEIKIIEHNSLEYQQMVALRTDILRRPLGLFYTKQQLDLEKSDTLIAAFENQKILGCCILSEFESQIIQLRQMAVAADQQYRGIGAKIISFAQNYCLQNQYKSIFLHARATAVVFYQKLGYKVIGEEYFEVGLSHFNMEKQLT